MEDKKIMKVIDEDGKELEFEIIMAFKWTKTNKNYIVYTDNKTNVNGELNIYACIYYPNDDSRLDEVKTDEEWDMIDKKLKELTKGNN